VRIRSLLHSRGFESTSDLLSRFPAKPYVDLAADLGNDMAALQLEWMQFEEAKEQGKLRDAAMDSLARELAGHLREGWGRGTQVDFNTAGVFADWVTRLEDYDPDLVPRAEAVWQALHELRPPEGWKPEGPDNPLLAFAFDKGWPRA